MKIPFPPEYAGIECNPRNVGKDGNRKCLALSKKILQKKKG
jgi:hypothetical protein